MATEDIDATNLFATSIECQYIAAVISMETRRDSRPDRPDKAKRRRVDNVKQASTAGMVLRCVPP